MNVTPTSGPIAASITHHARAVMSSRHSFATRIRRARVRQPAASGEGKKQVLEARRRVGARERGELVDGPFAARAPAAQEHEAIADAGGVGDLVDGEDERAAVGGVAPQRPGNFASLAEVESVE